MRVPIVNCLSQSAVAGRSRKGQSERVDLTLLGSSPYSNLTMPYKRNCFFLAKIFDSTSITNRKNKAKTG